MIYYAMLHLTKFLTSFGALLMNRKLQLFWVFLLLPFFVQSQSPVWQQFPNSPSGTDRHDDIFFVDANTGWSVRSNGYIHKTTDGGATWVVQANQPATHFRCLGFTSATRGWAGNLGKGSFSAATDTLPLYETFNGGTTWTAVPGLAEQGVKGMCALHVLDANHIYGGGRVRGPAHFIRSTDGGVTWTVIDLTAMGLLNGIMDVYFKDPLNGFIIGMDNNPYVAGCGGVYHGRIIKTTDGGNTWTTVLTTPTECAYFWKIVFPTPSTGYVSLQQNGTYNDVKYYKTTDGGNTWVARSIPLSSIGSPSSFFVQGIGFADANKGWIGGSSYTAPYSYNLIQTTDGGTTWTTMGYEDSRRMNKFRFTNANLGYSAGTKLHKYAIPTTNAADEPCTASTLPVNGVAVSGSLVSTLTQTATVPAPTNFSNTSSTTAQIWNTANVCEDLWYKVTVPESGGFIASFTSTGGSSDLSTAIYSGTCSATSPVGFAQIGADDGATVPRIAVGCRMPGETLYIRIWRYGCTGTGTIATFNITLTDLSNGTQGEEPATAIVLNPNNPYFGTSLSTTHNDSKGSIPAPFSCVNAVTTNGGFTFGKGCEDMWFSITATTAGSLTVEIDNAAGGSTDLSMALYSGNCTNLTQLICDGDNGNAANPRLSYNVVAGQTYYARIWEYGCDHTTAVTYNIRAYYPAPTPTTPPTATGADNPCDAVYLPTTATAVSGSITASLTQTSGVPAPTNFSNTSSTAAQIWNTANICEDRWYRIIVPASGGFRVDFTSTGGSSDLALALYSGSCSGTTPVNFAQLGADDGATLPKISISCRAPGEVIYLRLWRFGCTGTGTIASYTVTVRELYSTVVADEPITALGLGVGSPYLPATLRTDHYESKNAAAPTACVGASATGGFAINSGCEDMWFYADLPTSDYYYIETDNAAGGSTDISMAIYNSNCPGAVSQLLCDNDDGNLLNPRIRYFATAPQRIYIRVWENGCDFTTNVTFNIRAYKDYIYYDLPLCTTKELAFGINTPVSVDNAAQTNAAITFPTIPDPTACSAIISGSWTTEAANSRQDTWLKVVVPPSGAFRIDVVSTGGAADPEAALYATANGQCGTPTILVACDGDGGAGISSLLQVGCRAPGEVMYLRIWDYGTNNLLLCDVLATQVGAPLANDELSSASTIATGASSIVNIDATFLQSWVNPAPTCGSFNAQNACEDAWYKTTVPANGQLTANLTASENVGIAAYIGNCVSGLSLLNCSSGIAPSLVLSGLSVGSTVYWRVWDEGCDAFVSGAILDVQTPPSSGSKDDNKPNMPIASEKATWKIVTLFPNPVNDLLYYTLLSDADEQVIINVFDLKGNKYFEQTVQIRKGEQRLSTDVGQLSAGLYFLQLTKGSNGQRSIAKFAKSN